MISIKKWNAAAVRIVLILALLLSATASFAFVSTATVYANETDTCTPTFPSPDPWFDWGQRYINQIAGTGMGDPQQNPPVYTFLKGYGNYEPDLIVNGDPYKVNIVMAPMPPTYDMGIVSRAYLKSIGNPWELHWYMKGSWDSSMSIPGTLFDGDLLNFEYPLYLGKTWADESTLTHPVYGPLPVTTEATVIAYIDPVLDSSGAIETYNVIPAEGCDYQLPDLNCNQIIGDDVESIPQPLREVGDISWGEMLAMPDGDARIGWEDVTVPAGPYAGRNIQGYYVVEQTIDVAGQVTEMEAWKDVRGFIPIQRVKRSGEQYATMTIAKRWTGNFQWFEYEFGGPARTFKVRVNDTAIGEGGGTFQFTTWNKDFGVKCAGEAMTVDMDKGKIRIKYEDEYITCNARMRRVFDDTWVGFARVKDLVTGRIYVAVGIIMNC